MTNNHAILEAALDRITAGYVFPERTAAVDAAIRRRMKAGEYDGLTGPDLCTLVTGHLQEACPDKHLRLMWVDEPQSVEDDPEEVSAARFAADCRAANYGISRVEWLDGGIGYLDLSRIAPAELGGPSYAAAMQLFTPAEALVIDLRKCRGGSPDGVALWCSYLLAGDVHLNDIYERGTDFTRQFWTVPNLPGPRFPDRPVAVLTSDFTFSGGEELAYNLKVQGRATLVGETTRGGAHPTDWLVLTPHIAVTVPAARSINPITGTNWEGVGVAPDLAVPAAEALDVALAHLRGQLQPAG